MAFWGGYSPLAAAAASAEVLPETVTPSAGSAAITGFAPVVLVGMTVALGAGSVATQSTGWVAPKVETATNTGGGSGGILLALNTLLENSGVTVTPSAGSVSLTGQQPTLVVGVNRQPSAGSLSLSGYAPAPLQNHIRTPSVGALTLTGHAPTTVGSGAISPSEGSLSLAGYAPTTVIPITATPSVGSAAFTGYAPTVVPSGAGGGGYGGLLASLALNFEPVATRSPNAGSLGITGYAPTILGTSGSSGSGLLVALGSLTEPANLTGQYRPSSGTVSLTGYAPSTSRTVNDLGWDEFESGPSAVSGTGTKGAVYDPKTAAPSSGTLAFTGYAPFPATSRTASPAVGSLSLSGHAPTLTRNFVVTPSSGSVTVEYSAGYGYGLLRYGRDVYGVTRYEYVAANSGPQTGLINFIGYRPTVTQVVTVTPSSGSVGIAGYNPVIPITVVPSSGSIGITGYAPTAPLANPARLPLSGELTFLGYAPTLVRMYTNLPSVWQGGRAFIETYTDSSASLSAISGPSTVVFGIGQAATGTGDFVSGGSSVSFRQWTTQTVTTNIWTDQGTASGVWTELTPNTDVWNG